MRTYDKHFEYTSEKGTLLTVHYSGEFDDTYDRVTKGRYLVDVDFIIWDGKDLRDFIQKENPDLLEEIENAAVYDFMNRGESKAA